MYKKNKEHPDNGVGYESVENLSLKKEGLMARIRNFILVSAALMSVTYIMDFPRQVFAQGEIPQWSQRSRDTDNPGQRRMKRVTQEEREAAAARMKAAYPAMETRITEIREGLKGAQQARLTELKDKTALEASLRGVNTNSKTTQGGAR
jgi:hypothetical protein